MLNRALLARVRRGWLVFLVSFTDEDVIQGHKRDPGSHYRFEERDQDPKRIITHYKIEYTEEPEILSLQIRI